MKRPSLICFLLLTCIAGLYSQNLPFSEPVKVSIQKKKPVNPYQLEIEIKVEMAEHVHMYTDEAQFFKIEETISTGLDASELALPEIKQFTFGSTKSNGFSGKQTIVIMKPYSGNSGEAWEFSGNFNYQVCSDTVCFPPAKKEFAFKGLIPEAATADKTESASEEKPDIKEPFPGKTANTGIKVPFYKKGLLLGILGSFIAGLLLGLTPCVYPMVGITLAIIGTSHASRKKNVFLTFMYVLGLSLVYAGVGVIVASLGSKASNFFRSAWVLFPIGGIFVLLGLSMFDLFTIQTPSSMGGKIQKLGKKLKGSVSGTFLMGALSAFVVGPCVSGPLIGLITFVAKSGELLRGFAYFFALAWGMGSILFIAGSASGALPKAGMWMNRVKHMLGIVLIWAAFYFTRPFIGETAYLSASIIGMALGLNALGLFALPEQGHRLKPWLKLVLGIIVLASFTAHNVHDLMTHQIGHRGMIDFAREVEKQNLPPLETFDNLIAFSTKPVLLDFSATWCVICKEIAKTTLQEPQVKAALEKYTLIGIDYDNFKDNLVNTYNIKGVPAFIFIDKNGNQIGETIVTGEDLKDKLLSDNSD